MACAAPFSLPTAGHFFSRPIHCASSIGIYTIRLCFLSVLPLLLLSDMDDNPWGQAGENDNGTDKNG
jgi:hypothetical protein